MTGFLAPKVNSDIGFEQPVTTPSIAGGVADLATAFLSSRPSATKPSAAEVKGTTLRPFMKRLDDLRNSDLTDQDFLRHARKLGREWSVTHPEYQGDISTALEGYGVTKPADIVALDDEYTQGLNEWTSTPAGQYAILQAQVTDTNGALDMESTVRNVNVAYQEHLAQRAAIDATAQEMELVKGREDLWKANSSTVMEKFVPQWTTKTTNVVNSLFTLVASGDEQVDTYEEQMAFLRQQRRVLANEYTLEAQAAGLHSSSYKGEGANNISAALAPLDQAIAMGENMAADPGKALGALKAMNEAKALEMGLKTFGSYFILPEFQRAVFPVVGAKAFKGDELTGYLQGLDDQTAIGGVSLLQGRISVEDAQVAAKIAEQDGTADMPAVVKTATDTIASPTIPESDARDAAIVVEQQYKMLRVANKLLGPSVLENVYNTQAVKNVTALVASGSEEGALVREQYVTFAAEQVQMNMMKIEAELEALNVDAHVEMIDNELFYIEGGVRVPARGELAKAIQNINTINANSATILGLDRSKPSTTLDRATLRDVDEVKKYLEGVEQEVSGGEGDTQLDGSQGNDTLGATALVGLIDRTEGGADYDTLFNYSNREGGQFAGTRVSQMTIGDLLAFSDGAYADYSRAQLGYKATPMGRYQIVGDTLEQTAKEMGLHNNIRFTAEVQDAMFHHLAKKALSGKVSPAAKRKAMRATWEGFKKENVSDAELDVAIAQFEGTEPPAYTELQGSVGVGITAPRPQARPEDLSTAVGVDRVRPVARPEAGSAALSGQVEGVQGVTPQKAAKVAPEDAKKVLANVAAEQKAFLIRLFGDEDLVLQAIQDGTISLEDAQGV